MNNRYYLRLSRDNIKKNAKMYIPYIFTCVLMTAMLYIIRSLSKNPDFENFAHGGTMLPTLLKYGSYVTAAFAVVIIFYSNSFILNRRNREFGLLNILGMEKRHIAKLLLIETVHIAAVTFVLGILVGIGLEALITGLLAKMLGDEAAKLSAHISPSAILDAVCFIGLTFVGVFLFALRSLHLSNPVELLSGAKKGEKEPKTKIFMTILGVLFLIGGYALSFFVADPRQTLHLLAAAVFFVILGTYLIFTAGIIALLKLLKKRKNFYYKTKHFTAVSGLIYRMKRNAVGLSSVAILSTMVLISVSSTSALMLGIDNQLPDADVVIGVNSDKGGIDTKKIISDIEEKAKPKNIDIQRTATMKLKGRDTGKITVLEKGDYTQNEYYVSFVPAYEGGLKSNQQLELRIQTYDSIDERYVDDKNQDQDVLFKRDAKDIKKDYYTEKGEIVIEAKDKQFDSDTFSFLGKEFKVRKFKQNVSGDEDRITITVATNEEVAEFVDMFNKQSPFAADENYRINIFYDGNIAQSDRNVKSALGNKLDSEALLPNNSWIYPATFRSEEKAGMMLAYGSLFFLGIFLGTLFVLETILIIYYKQLTEGYEDASRFKIMQNVGMSEDEVKKSIRSQILLVFFLPLVTALIHTVVAFPLVGRLLSYVGLDSTKTYLKSCGLGFAGYIVLYTVIYVLTAKLYYGIIKKQK